jgi:hypothetical protein
MQRKAEKLQHIYHAVPSPMFGNILYPLNDLHAIYPDAYELAVRKYEWRKSLLDQIIPRLECLWNDVLHFTLIHPNHIFEELKAAGYSGDASVMFYEIPIESVTDLPYAIYHTPAPIVNEFSYSVDHQAPDHEIDPALIQMSGEFDPKYPEFPNSTREYYRFECSRARRPLVFNGLPHFLLRSPLEISGFEKVDWNVQA